MPGCTGSSVYASQKGRDDNCALAWYETTGPSESAPLLITQYNNKTSLLNGMEHLNELI